jgi:hypothetical protein
MGRRDTMKREDESRTNFNVLVKMSDDDMAKQGG